MPERQNCKFRSGITAALPSEEVFYLRHKERIGRNWQKSSQHQRLQLPGGENGFSQQFLVRTHLVTGAMETTRLVWASFLCLTSIYTTAQSLRILKFMFPEMNFLPKLTFILYSTAHLVPGSAICPVNLSISLHIQSDKLFNLSIPHINVCYHCLGSDPFIFLNST